ncbi:DUF914 domain membrane protein [Talaromyces stipitatus ATCC 10500]|uniref:DUF914 domain membrane protein n=1 Tax=Talaromyces stipitatus (strain ATCC 10500 / CBS 375.48 / QM 6759 / NRRL 1006) TaxID=441959 RepID=B8MQ15_TALSN|nr:DUF914 domain membrane protein [Talaromyces stipitatus ATCC 10500]EED12905.1 DUF914 domain membrane protein [Talaromyces stipitatus ATCC 10500]
MAASEPLIAARGDRDSISESQYDALLGQDHVEQSDEEVTDNKRQGLFAYLRTKDFWTILLLGQTLAILNTSSSTFTSLLEAQGTSIPAFQTFFNYALLNIVFTSFTIYKYGFKHWAQIARSDGWKYILFAFCDVEGNYFIVLAYRYTTILSAQLINFWAIVVVVILSFLTLHVRYHTMQILGISICIGGMGILLASDRITGSTSEGEALDPVKGDLFALLAATFYGFSNVVEEYFVSKRPVYEVIGQLSFWATIINGIQAFTLDRSSFETATWNRPVLLYLLGYTICLASFYTTAPLIYRLASAAFMNISMLTGNFWGVLIGVFVLKLQIHWLYPLAFVMILLGQFVYYLGPPRRDGSLGEARKPWLGRNQEQGVSGIFTARRRIVDRARDVVSADGLAG